MNTAQDTTANETITLRGREFTVTTQETKYDAKQYVFTGKRGAVYGTMRNKNNPDRMFLIDGRGFGLAKGYEGLWLSDKSGKLEVVCR